jgi:hypothetical protein
LNWFNSWQRRKKLKYRKTQNKKSEKTKQKCRKTQNKSVKTRTAKERCNTVIEFQDEEKRDESVLIVICATAPVGYTTDNGVKIVPVGCLKD